MKYQTKEQILKSTGKNRKQRDEWRGTISVMMKHAAKIKKKHGRDSQQYRQIEIEIMSLMRG